MSHLRFLSAALVIVLFAASAFAADVARIVVTGDSRGSDNGVNSAMLTELVTAIIAEQADVVLFSGDLTNNGYQGQLEYWVQLFMDPLAAAGIPVYACRGNHDASVTAWNAIFTGDRAFPANGPAGKINLTYAVATDNALFLVLDGYVIDQPWIDQQLQGKTQPHLFLVNHYPAFQVAHADCLAINPQMRDTFWNSIGLAGARTFFCGHDHFYDHAAIHDVYDNPIHQYVVGTAGAPLYDWGGTYADPRVQGIAHYKNYGYVVVDIDDRNVMLTYKDRVAPNVYEATTDVYTYDAILPSENLPASGRWFMLIALALIVAASIYTGRRHLAARRIVQQEGS